MATIGIIMLFFLLGIFESLYSISKELKTMNERNRIKHPDEGTMKVETASGDKYEIDLDK